MVVIQIVTYGMSAVFVLAVLIRFVRISRLPPHVRWELYPVAHEKGKAHYGGSYYEEHEWWTKPREVSLVGELKFMIPEILLLAGVWHHNKAHWFRSFPFHFGLYLIIGLIVLLLAGGIATAAGAAIGPGAGGPAGLLHTATVIVGYAGLFLALLGSLLLLGRRLANPDYRDYTKRMDYANLVFFIVALGVSLASRFGGDAQFEGLRAYFARLVTMDLSAPAAAPGLLLAEIALASVLIAYVPLTHMSHFFTKWFMYHDIRWSDAPLETGGKIEKEMLEVLNYPVTWSAPHIGADGKKNWVDVATTIPEEGGES